MITVPTLQAGAKWPKMLPNMLWTKFGARLHAAPAAMPVRANATAAVPQPSPRLIYKRIA
jgi:hypothetical protein